MRRFDRERRMRVGVRRSRSSGGARRKRTAVREFEAEISLHAGVDDEDLFVEIRVIRTSRVVDSVADDVIVAASVFGRTKKAVEAAVVPYRGLKPVEG